MVSDHRNGREWVTRLGKRNGRINISNTKRKYCRYYPEEDHLPGAGAGTEDCGTGSGKGI